MSIEFDAGKMGRVATALGDPYRIRILERIKGERDWTSCKAIIAMLDLAQSTVSHHMKQLVDAGLLFAVKEGRDAKYRINDETVDTYVKFITRFRVGD